MAEKKVAPYGSWKSPITSDLIVAGTIGLGDMRLNGEDVYWIESRPSEGGRSVIVRRTPDVPSGRHSARFNARTTSTTRSGAYFGRRRYGPTFPTLRIGGSIASAG